MMATKTYLRLLDKARCTVNFGAGNIFDDSKPMDEQQRISFLIARLAQFKVRGYSKEYITQLVREDLTRAK